MFNSLIKFIVTRWTIVEEKMVQSIMIDNLAGKL